MKIAQIAPIAASVLVLGYAATATALEQSVVQTDNGPVQGVVRTTTTTFFGVPFSSTIRISTATNCLSSQKKPLDREESIY
jgi:hypothetical protein